MATGSGVALVMTGAQAHEDHDKQNDSDTDRDEAEDHSRPRVGRLTRFGQNCLIRFGKHVTLRNPTSRTQPNEIGSSV